MNSRHRLLIYDAFGRWLSHRVLLGLIAVFAVVMVDLYYPFWGDFRLVAWLLAAGLLLVWFFLFSWVRQTAVYLRRGHLQIQGPFFSLRIPYDQVLSVTHARLSDHHTPDRLSVDRMEWLANLYFESCAFVLTRENPLPSSLKRRFFSPLIFSPDRPGVLLLVPDWVELARKIEAARAAETGRRNGRVNQSAFEDMLQPGMVMGERHAPLLLIADDSPAQCKQFERMLQGRYRLLFATDGIEALRHARDNVPDLILTMQHLANLNGLQLLAAVRKTQKMAEIPVIFIAREPFPRALAAGANDVIVRPFVAEDLIARIDNALRLRRLIGELRAENEKLHGQTLNQMAELVRKGELVNFLPQPVAKGLMAGGLVDTRETLQRQKVTVLFVDLVGFTDLTGRLNPGVLSALVNDFLREMTAIAIAHHGTVDKFIGDEVMVLFGAPEPQEEPAQVRNATLTALGMQAAIRELSLRWKSRLPVDLTVRIGFNTGYGTAGVFGDELLRTYTVVGSVVNIAARLRAAAQPGQIVCSAECFDLIQAEFRGDSLGHLDLKGINFPLEAYAIHGRLTELTP